MTQQNPMEMEEYLKMLGLGQDNQRIDDAMKMQMAQADFLRQGSAPELRQAGRLVKAPGWMELLGGLARNKAAADLTQGVQHMQGQRRDNVMQQNQALIRAMLGGQQVPPPGAAPVGGTGLDPTTATPANGLTVKGQPWM